MPDVAIVTPAYDGRLHDDHARSVEEGRAALRAKGYSSIRRVIRGDAVLPRVRNHCIAAALAAGAKQIVMVDSDIGFDPAVLVRIVEHDAAIVGAAPQAQLFNWRNAGAPRLVWRPFPGEHRTDERGLAPARGLATGFLKVRAEVFSALREKGLARPYIYPGTDPALWPHLAMYFFYSLAPADLVNDPALKAQCDALGIPDEQRCIFEGEDYYFCDRAREAGFESFLDVAIGVRHWEGRCVHDFSLIESLQTQEKDAAA